VAVKSARVNAGWTAGAGVEAAVWGNWTWKAEYLYVDLGSVEQMGVVLGVACTPCLVPHPVSGGQTTARTHFTDDIVRTGLNYKFY
jgi:outer membrane immunogenic protein